MIIRKSPQKAALQVQAKYSRFIYLSFLVSIDLPNESHTDSSQPEQTAVHLICLSGTGHRDHFILQASLKKKKKRELRDIINYFSIYEKMS